MKKNNIKLHIRQILLLLIVVFFGFGFYKIYISKYLERNLSITLKRFAENMNNECPIAIGF